MGLKDTIVYGAAGNPSEPSDKPSSTGQGWSAGQAGAVVHTLVKGEAGSA
jgi:hypothetical protein